jgi:hypothetical protein
MDCIQLALDIIYYRIPVNRFMKLPGPEKAGIILPFDGLSLSQQEELVNIRRRVHILKFCVMLIFPF